MKNQLLTILDKPAKRLGMGASILACLLVAGGCASGRMDRELIMDREGVTGSFDMIRVGGTFADDAERIVILDIEDDPYSFRPVAGPGRVRQSPGLSANEALRRAELFFSDHCAYNGYQLRKLILPETGKPVGYELTPNYPASLCEAGNEVLVNYTKPEDGEIKVYTSLLLKVKDGSGGSLLDFDLPRLKGQ